MLLSVKMSVTYTFFKKIPTGRKHHKIELPSLKKYEYGQITLVSFFRRTYALSVGLKMKPLRKKYFPVLRQKPT